MPDPQTAAPSPASPVVPAGIESPRAKLSYLYLRVAGSARLDELRDALGISLLCLYPTVERLVQAGLVERTEDGLLRARAAAPPG